MLYKYKAKIKPDLDSKNFQYFDYALLSRRRRILDKWFYFYINNAIKPIVVWKDVDTIGFQIQPGCNRYIGTALRKSNQWIDAVYITNNPDLAFEEIDKEEIIDTLNQEAEFEYITLDNNVHRWGVGDQTLYDNSWIQPVYDWIHSNLKYRYGLKFDGHIFYVNSERRLSSLFKRTKLVVDAKDFLTVKDAVAHLFKTIQSLEFRNL